MVAAEASTDAAEVADGLAHALAAAWGGEVAITDLDALSSGASRQTWRFTAAADRGKPRPLILQCAQPGLDLSIGMAPQAQLMRAAAGQGAPVPEVVAGSADQGAVAGLGAEWVVVSQVDGETIPQRILRDDALAEARAGLAEQCGRVLARIHRIPLEEVPDVPRKDALAAYRDTLDLLGQPHPVFEVALRWLVVNRPAKHGPAVVHGDFRHGNFIVAGSGIAAVIDWELAYIGDPMEDLGWLCVKAWRFGREPPVGGFGRREDLWAGYANESGTPVDAAVAHWWEVFGTLKWGIICIAQAARFRVDGVRSVELAAIGRRVCEVEHDLLSMLHPGLASTMSPDTAAAPAEPVQEPLGEPAAGGEPHDVPTAAELTGAVRDLLADDAVVGAESGVTGRARYLLRVAANVLGMVEREILLGPDQRDAHRARLARLGVPDDGALARVIRAGELDPADPTLLTGLAESVRDKLLVANPGYLDA